LQYSRVRILRQEPSARPLENTIDRPNAIVTTSTHDVDGRLVRIDEGGLSSIALTREGNDHVTSASRYLPLAASVIVRPSLALSYDAASQVASSTYDGLWRLVDNGERTFAWNLASMLTSVTQGGETTSFTDDATGLQLSRSRAGVTRSYAWDCSQWSPSVSVERGASPNRSRGKRPV